MIAADDRIRRRLIARLNRQPMPVKRQVAISVFLAAALIVIGAIGWMCRH